MAMYADRPSISLGCSQADCAVLLMKSPRPSPVPVVVVPTIQKFSSPGTVTIGPSRSSPLGGSTQVQPGFGFCEQMDVCAAAGESRNRLNTWTINPANADTQLILLVARQRMANLPKM